MAGAAILVLGLVRVLVVVVVVELVMLDDGGRMVPVSFRTSLLSWGWYIPSIKSSIISIPLEELVNADAAAFPR